MMEIKEQKLKKKGTKFKKMLNAVWLSVALSAVAVTSITATEWIHQINERLGKRYKSR